MAFLDQLPELRLIRAGAKGVAREKAFVAWRKWLLRPSAWSLEDVMPIG